MTAPWLPSLRGLPRSFWVLWVGMLVNRVGSFVQPFLALYLVGERGFSEAHAGEIVSTVGAGILASGPLGGGLADRIGRRPALALATGLDAAAMLSLGFARSPAAIGVAAFAVGLFGEMYRPISMAMIADVVRPEDRPRAYGLVYWVVNLGFAIASCVAGLVAATSYSALFVGDAAAGLLFGALVVSQVAETRPAARTPAPVARGAVEAPAWSVPYRHRAFMAFVGVAFSVGLMFYQIGTTLPLDMGAHGVGPRDFGLLLALNGVLVVLLQPPLSELASRARRNRAMALGALLTGVGFGLGAFAGASPVAVYAVSVVVWSLGEIVMSGIAPAVVADFAPAHLRGTYQGAFQLAWGAATLLAPAGGAAVLQRFGPEALWGTIFGIGALGAVGYLRVVPER